MALTADLPASAPRRIAILGATGSVGQSTLDLVRRANGAYAVETLTANGNLAGLVALAREFRPRFVALGDPSQHEPLKAALAGTGIASGAGLAALVEAAERPSDWVMAGIVGIAGLAPTMAAVRRGAVVAFANKECMVSAGAVMVAAIRRHGATLIPVDSEHNAIFQVFDFERPETVERLVLTASGGPFRTWPTAAMARVTPGEAVRHPNWRMGAKISIDSATMMNKGLEVIEAHHLFQMPEDRIDVVVHPQSIVHSLVAYVDGSVLAQLGSPDMRTPIGYALAWPSREATPAARLDLAALAQLTFESPDETRFPALALARAALRGAGGAPTILNAANEVAVAAFLAGRIGFLDIVRVVEGTLERIVAPVPATLDAVNALDQESRRVAAERVGGIAMAV